MSIPIDLETWLAGAGYRHYCFVSWAHADAMRPIARRIASELDAQLGLLAGPLAPASERVFLDTSDIEPGINWHPFLSTSLCRSVIMVALCADIYFKPYHQFCGLEWAAMHRLGTTRLAGSPLNAIHPLIIQKTDPLPSAPAAIQYIDLSGIVTASRSYYNSRGFKTAMSQVVSHIVRVAGALRMNNSRTGCEGFAFPLNPTNFEEPSQQRFPTLRPPMGSAA